MLIASSAETGAELSGNRARICAGRVSGRSGTIWKVAFPEQSEPRRGIRMVDPERPSERCQSAMQVGSNRRFTEFQQRRYLVHSEPECVNEVHHYPLTLRQFAKCLGKSRLDPSLSLGWPSENGWFLAASSTALTDAIQVADWVRHDPDLVPSFPCHSQGLGRRFAASVGAVGSHEPPTQWRFRKADEQPKARVVFGPRRQPASSLRAALDDCSY